MLNQNTAKMRKSKSNFNAIGTFMELSKILEDTNNEVLRLYSEEFARIPYDSKNFRMKLTSPEMMSLVQTKIQDMGAFLKTTPLETMLFIAIYSVETVRLCSVDARDITKFFGISNIDFLVLRKFLSSLLEKGLIRPVERRRRDEEYRITSAAERALFDNKPYKVTKAPPMDRYKFCNTISSLIEDRKQQHIDTRELFKLVEEEEDRQEHLTLVQEMRKLLPEVPDRTLFYEICDDFVTERPRLTSVEVTLSDIYDSMRYCFIVAKSIMGKEHNLQTNDLIELLPAQFLAGA
jgi:predicted transcriptional regulator